MDLTGEQIRDVLEQSVENVTTTEPGRKVGGMIQVSGLYFSYLPDNPPGERIRELVIGERPASPDTEYRVVVNGLLAQGGHNYRTFLEGRNRRREGWQYPMLRQWLSDQQTVSAPRDRRMVRLTR